MDPHPVSTAGSGERGSAAALVGRNAFPAVHAGAAADGCSAAQKQPVRDAVTSGSGDVERIDSPVWQAPPSQPSGQLQIPGATQTPPFLQPWGQMARGGGAKKKCRALRCCRFSRSSGCWTDPYRAGIWTRSSWTDRRTGPLRSRPNTRRRSSSRRHRSLQNIWWLGPERNENKNFLLFPVSPDNVVKSRDEENFIKVLCELCSKDLNKKNCVQVLCEKSSKSLKQGKRSAGSLRFVRSKEDNFIQGSFWKTF